MAAEEHEDLLFARYRKRGDPDLLAQVFDHTAPRLLRLAIHMSRDPAEAEDLVQATFVTAIEKARQFDGDRPVLPWLTGILEHHAREARSKAARQIVPERLRGRPVTTPVQHAESRELDDAVARGLDKLPERYRPVMVLKLRHGLKPAEIADALGRSPGAVRVQIHRGTELLKNYLPVGLALSSVLGLTPTLGLAAMRCEIRRYAAAQCALAVKTAGIGGLLMKKTTTVVLGALLVTGAVLYVATDPGPAPLFRGDGGSGGEGLRAGRGEGLTADAGPVPGRDTADLPVQRIPVPVQASGPGGGILVRTLWADDRSPARGVGLVIRPHDGRHPDLYTERGATDRDGAVLFGALEPGDYGVYVDRDAVLPDDVVATDSDATASESIRFSELNLFVMGTLEEQPVRTRVLTIEKPVTDFSFSFDTQKIEFVRALDESSLEAGIDQLPLDELRALLNDLRASSRLPDEKPVAVETVEDDVVYLDVLVDRGLVVEGRAFAPDGSPVAEAEIWVRGRSRGDAHLLARTGDEGTFRLEGMEERSRVWAQAPGFMATDEVVVAEGHELELRFSQTAFGLSARVLDRGGHPVVGASVRIGDPGGDFKPIQLRSDGEGQVATDGIPPGPIPVLVLASGYQPYRELLEIRKDAPGERDFVLDPGWMAVGHLRDFEGEGQEGTTIYADAEGRPTTEVTTGPGGGFRLECLPPGPVSLRVDEGEHRALLVPIQGSSGDVQTVDLVLPPWGEIAGRIVDDTGNPLEGWQVRGVAEDAPARVGRSDEHGAFSMETEPELKYLLEVLPPREHTFNIVRGTSGEVGRISVVADLMMYEASRSSGTSANPGWKTIPVTWLGAVSGIRDNLEIVVPSDLVPSARVRGRISDSVGSPLKGSIRVHVDGGSRSVRLDGQGAFDIGPLIPGDYAFQVVSRDQAFPSFYLDPETLAPHQELDLGTVVPPLGGSLSVSLMDGRAEPGKVTARILDDRGRELATLDAVGPLGHTVPLAPGTYTVELLGDGKVVGSGTARVLARETTQLPMKLQ